MKLYFDEKYFINPASELVLIAPFINQFRNDIRFKEIWNNKNNERTSIEECDYVVMPYKWNKYNPNNNILINEAITHDKKVLIFHIDDSDEEIVVNNSYIFRTSFYKSSQKSYEKAIPCFKEDKFKENYLKEPKLKIGFCGQTLTKLRYEVIETLNKSNIDCDFILRKVAWPNIEQGKTKEMVENEFYENMTNNLFNLCIRGGGNFSYRIYETLMFGRVPIIIDSDIVLPYDDIIDWNNHGVIVKKNDDIVSKILYFYKNTDMEVIQYNNRKFWEDYLSPKGFIKNFNKMINI